MSATDGLSMIDEYGSRKRIIPAEVKGPFRDWRNRVYFILMIIFLGAPWVTVNGHQALLLDIPGRRFEIFGAVFLSHDTPLLFFIFALLVLTIMITTALWGRVWCGWACPQTVFIDGVYRRIEQWIEGNYIKRRQLHNGPMTAEKFGKVSAKWLAYFIVSSLFAHSFIAYFTGSRQLIAMMSGSPKENWTYFLVVSAVTALLLFNFGWFREQFCIIMCPYGRFQSVLMDSHSLNVTYDEKRGEPRKAPDVPPNLRGDCVSCNRCVQVCPTGIDIRNGIQMECIGCTACIDACDEIMVKVNKPKGLISYSAAVKRSEVKPLRPRVVAYLFLFAVCSAGLGYNLIGRQPFNVAVLRAQDTPYQVGPDGWVINHFKVNVHNQSSGPERFRVKLAPGVLGESQVRLNQASPYHELQSGASREIHLFISFPKDVLDEKGRVPLQLEILETERNISQVLHIPGVGPIPLRE